MKDFSSKEFYESRIKRQVISAEEIQKEIQKAGKIISDSYDGRPILLVSVLKGAFVFLSDLARAITVPCEMSKQNFDACASEKQLVIFEGAGHGMAYLVDDQKYINALKEFEQKHYARP